MDDEPYIVGGVAWVSPRNLAKVHDFHLSMIQQAKDVLGLDLQDVNVSENQMVFWEYLQASHDEGYTYFIHELRLPAVTRAQAARQHLIAVCINSRFVDEVNDAEATILDRVAAAWSTVNGTTLKMIQSAPKVSEANFMSKDLQLVTVHLIYRGMQVFKILYPKTAIDVALPLLGDLA